MWSTIFRQPFEDEPALLGVYFASRTGGTRRGGATTARKTTARGGGAKSAAARRRSVRSQSETGGRSNAKVQKAPTASRPASARRSQRGPGGAGKAIGRSQSAAGKGRGVPKYGR